MFVKQPYTEWNSYKTQASSDVCPTCAVQSSDGSPIVRPDNSYQVPPNFTPEEVQELRGAMCSQNSNDVSSEKVQNYISHVGGMGAVTAVYGRQAHFGNFAV